MATVITNQANVSYQYGLETATASSNVASTVLQSPIGVVKSSLAANYSFGEEITYQIGVTNSGSTALTNVTVTDNLGAYALTGGTTVRPLTYVGPATLFISNGSITPITPTAQGNDLVFTIPAIPAEESALISYVASINEFAPLGEADAITNTASVSAAGIADAQTADYTLPASASANLTVTKTMSPNPVLDGDNITYTFILRNFGNQEATNISLTDQFLPAPTITDVTSNGTAVTNYTYNGGLFTYPSPTGTVSVPAATITQDATTGVVTVTPGELIITVTGTL